jgi:hypothetical protein
VSILTNFSSNDFCSCAIKENSNKITGTEVS